LVIISDLPTRDPRRYVRDIAESIEESEAAADAAAG
jgi:hypothetical protein